MSTKNVLVTFRTISNELEIDTSFLLEGHPRVLEEILESVEGVERALAFRYRAELKIARLFGATVMPAIVQVLTEQFPDATIDTRTEPR